MRDTVFSRFSVLAVCGGILVGLPISGLWLTGSPILGYMQFPPLTQNVAHAEFSMPVFLGLAVLTLVVCGVFVLRVTRSQKGGVTLPSSVFPIWGWWAILWTVAWWVIAWTRLSPFSVIQEHTFFPLWIGYILVVNAITQSRSGTSMVTSRSRYFVLLFLLSAGFWWFFEFLNRFVENWYYEGGSNSSGIGYVVSATLPFATVLPAVLGTYDCLKTFPRLQLGLDRYTVIKCRYPQRCAVLVLTLFSLGLGLIGVFPNELYPLLWIAPLVIVLCLRSLLGQPTLLRDLGAGDWRRICLLCLSGLVCGVFWELWNWLSLSRWVYSVPYVDTLHVFEMPLLGFAGYLPFGLECAIIAEFVSPFKVEERE